MQSTDAINLFFLQFLFSQVDIITASLLLEVPNQQVQSINFLGFLKIFWIFKNFPEILCIYYCIQPLITIS